MKLLYLTVALLIMINLSLVFDLVESKGRGGGGRGGGSRSGGSRSGGSRSGGSRWGGSSRSRSSGSGIRSGKTVNVYRVKVNKYNTWATRYNIRTSYRYGSASYYQKREALLAGMILMSHHHRVRYYDSYDSFERVSVCMNFGNIYNRNITVSPYFLCPWYKDPSYRYCCGDEYEQYCCRYFDRPSQKTWLVIMIIGLIVSFITGIYCCCKKCGKGKRSGTVVKLYQAEAVPMNNKYDVNINTELVEPPYSTESPPYPVDPPYPGTSPPYPNSDTPGMPLPQVDSHQNAPSAPYEKSDNPIGYNSSGPTYSLTPDNPNPTSPPPSYSSVVNANK